MADSISGPTGDTARPVNAPTGITKFLFTIGGIGMLLSPITMLVGAHHHEPDQNPATCSYARAEHPEWDLSTIGCQP